MAQYDSVVPADSKVAEGEPARGSQNEDDKKVFFEKAPLLGNLFLVMWSLCSTGCPSKCLVSPVAVRYLFLTVVLLVIKIVVPIAIFIETEAKSGAASWLHDLTGAAGWAMVAFQAEEDVLRDVWWLCASFKLRRVPVKDGALKIGRKEITGYTISCIYDSITGISFNVCTWQLMRGSTSIIEQATQCAALTAILLCDEAIYNHVQFDVPGVKPKFVTPWDMCVHEEDARVIVERADMAVWILHATNSLLYVGFFITYICTSTHFQ